ncbi:MAG: hypothetical protein JST50_18650 [Bacteroidetes bacterium]|jgi:hypothetical protein|nr:hypothetical protein [Bacteroidota bacterium]
MKATTSVIWTTIYLIVLYTVPAYSSSIILTGILYMSFPIIFILMVFIILKDDSVKAKKLEKDEWGYADKSKDELWII